MGLLVGNDEQVELIGQPYPSKEISAFGLGALVTAAHLSPDCLIHVISSLKPCTGSIRDLARLQKYSSLSTIHFSFSESDRWGRRSLAMSGFDRPLILALKKVSSTSKETPAFFRQSRKATRCIGSVSTSVPSISNSTPWMRRQSYFAD